MSNALETNMTSPLELGQRFGDFEIRELLGRGKAGFVYSALDLLSKRRCALKLLCRMSSHDLYRNKLGFRRMSPFRHPALMRTDRIEVIDKYTVLTMEEIEGETLYTFARRLRNLPRQVAYQKLHSLLHDYASGLAVMHFGGLVHRDLKPTNLMVRGNGNGVIVDYGLVANCDPETDPSGLRPYIAGTPRYFSPEALWEQSYTPAGDVFSLGLVMLDCLNEVAKNDQWLRRGEFADWVRDEDEQTIASAVSEMDEEIPPVLRMAIAGMLSADRSRRPSSLEIVSMTKTGDDPIRLMTTHHLFGRDQELEQCKEFIRDIYRGKTGRLHVYGVAGAGKTRLLDEIERQLRQSQWGQVFRVRCRSREKQNLQVIDQLADQVAQRYSQRDRERITLDSVSASILKKSFPQLKHVIVEDLYEIPASFDGQPQRLDALTAAKRLSRELRKVGPLFIIIDDIQWSDHDSHTMWDALLADTHGSLAIITSSRDAETQLRYPADLRLHLGPLPKDAAISFLQTAATRWGANINAAGLQELVGLSKCNAFRLHELAEEFRPGGMLHRVEASCDASISNLGDVDRFWRDRFDSLTDAAKSILAFIVAANEPVSIAELAKLTGLGEQVDISVFELVRQRLAIDDSSGTECVTVVHDKIAEGLIENLDPDEMRRAHLAWAELLKKHNRPRDFAARIAGHLYSAKQDGAALPFAILAAENADRAFMKADAAVWHERVLEQVAGKARLKHLRDAARCFEEADLPERAAPYYEILADTATDDNQRRRYKATATRLLVRSGRLDIARPLIENLSEELAILPRHAIAMAKCRSDLQQLNEQLARIDVESLRRLVLADAEHDRPDDVTTAMYFCSDATRSMVFLDFQGTIQLMAHGANLALTSGTDADRLHYGIRAQIWSGLLAGGEANMLAASRKYLETLARRLESVPPGRTTGDVWSGLAFLNLVSMRWKGVPKAVDCCMTDFGNDLRRLSFESTHTRWLKLWADWHLGQWDSLRSNANDMAEDADRRNDNYQRFVATSGFAGNGFLVNNNLQRLKQFGGDNCRIVSDTGNTELLHLFQWIHQAQVGLYEGRFGEASKIVRMMRRKLGQTPIRRITILQVVADYLLCLTSLHQRQHHLSIREAGAPAAAEPSSELAVIRGAIRRLNQQPFAFSQMLGALMRGVERRMAGRSKSAAKAFSIAAELASKQSLMPYQLAAEDGLMSLHPDAEYDSLRQLMVTRGIECPDQLERLYTVGWPTPIDH
ncbi:protein kinase domain-containing protein [Roseiconus lacunae]|uniref:AAA family ATPase n=2 Tax=Roseiconus lacunae TaxID=2605694 RepID=A0ABT7PHX8_9BACT|nr:AAA family ATPase [Roseiconus lacunae]MCD0461282.1 AAA family ATPase [Roseiconus lacunae]MDM4016109.1 AAA family ATPase [Roseiconus lacunae]